MNGYVKIKASEIPFYLSLANDGYYKYKDILNKLEKELYNADVFSKVSIFKPKTWFANTDSYYSILDKCEYYNYLTTKFFKLSDMLKKATDRSIYVDADSFDLLEKENN